MGQIIREIIQDSIAQEIGCEVGDELLAIDGQKIIDVIDYAFLTASEKLILTLRDHHNEEIIDIEIEKDEGEPIGFVFDSSLMSKQRSCGNHCLFCFVDQMPEGMRETLYFKDDDWRMSFMMGNFVTLTNVGKHELQRIIDRKVSPIYISVQTTDPSLRNEMLGNPKADEIMYQLKELAKNGIKFHAQIVLCPGLNDGAHLEKSLQDLYGLYPAVLSIACVPVGVTKFREKLTPIQPYQKEGAHKVLQTIQSWQRKCMKETQNPLVYASDEFYLVAQQTVPEESIYGNFDQIENGVGMVRKFESEFEYALENVPMHTAKGKSFAIVTGTLGYKWLSEISKRAQGHTGAKIDVISVENEFFGKTVTVTGLIVGQDLVARCKGKIQAETLLICKNMLKEDEDVFLDDMTLEEVEKAIGKPIEVVENDGEALLCHIAGWEEE